MPQVGLRGSGGESSYAVLCHWQCMWGLQHSWGPVPALRCPSLAAASKLELVIGRHSLPGCLCPCWLPSLPRFAATVPCHSFPFSPAALPLPSALQGGIDPRENPMQAALRELHEETAIRSCRIVASVRTL